MYAWSEHSSGTNGMGTALQSRGVVAVGSLVRVPLHGRRVGGWVVALGEAAAVAADRLVAIAKFSSVGPPPEVVELAAPVVVGHEAIAARFNRYVETAGYNEIINGRQFQIPGYTWPRA